MKQTLHLTVRFALVLLFAVLCVSGVRVHAQDTDLPMTLVPKDKMDVAWWKTRHEANCARIAQGNVDLLLIGDSITHGWDGAGKEIQEFFYGDRNAVNMGFGGDQPQHVLWRLNDAPMDKIQPKAAVLLIGINSLWSEWPNCEENVALGIKACVDKLQSLYPDIKILVLEIFVTHGPNAGSRKRAMAVNELLPGIFKDYKNVQLMDINDLWLDADGNIPKELMRDGVHPGREGYILWGNRVDAVVAEMLGVEAKTFGK
ncbi:MAG: hypothetical protein IJD43_07840 [Thermoguttaceae bacterium]|nr:hypothetical protein [Thermoguttaceae bacterium]